MTKNELKERVYAAIDRRAEEIVRLGERIRKHPELGFKEVKTARLIEETLAGIGLKPKTGLALTGVPAEEYGDIEWRVAQARAGKLEFLGGKPELLRLGHFDDVDLSMMIHLTSRPEDGKTGVPASNNGCIVKTIRYVGRASHAGGAPHMGINALYAAQVGLTAVNAIRETFRDEDTIRVHPIITHGGSQVNVIPGEVRLETYVRGRTVEAILDAQKKVDRALRAGALALGCTVEIETLPGYMPLRCDPLMVERF